MIREPDRNYFYQGLCLSLKHIPLLFAMVNLWKAKCFIEKKNEKFMENEM